MHSPELMLLLHAIDQRELVNELRARARGGRPGLPRRAWTAVARGAAVVADGRRAPRPAADVDCLAPCTA